jgi:predicted deacylase
MRKKLDVTELRKRTKIKDLLLLDQVQSYIAKQTGTLVTRCRIGRWVASGDLLTLRRSGRNGYRATRKAFVNDLIEKYTAS